jgi:hypothetical protein
VREIVGGHQEWRTQEGYFIPHKSGTHPEAASLLFNCIVLAQVDFEGVAVACFLQAFDGVSLMVL